MACARPFESTITGIINVTRSLYTCSYLNLFRKIFYETVHSRLRVVVGAACEEHLQRARRLLKWFLPQGPNSRLQRVLLEMLARSDWENQDEILIYVLPGEG